MNKLRIMIRNCNHFAKVYRNCDMTTKKWRITFRFLNPALHTNILAYTCILHTENDCNGHIYTITKYIYTNISVRHRHVHICKYTFTHVSYIRTHIYVHACINTHDVKKLSSTTSFQFFAYSLGEIATVAGIQKTH